MDDLISRQAVLDKAIYIPIAKIVTEDKIIYRRAVFVDEIEKLPSAEKTKWIPVSERLPQINELVLCQCRVGYKVLRLTSYGCYCNDTQEYMDSFVIAWMPLPSPFEPQESEDKE